MPDTIEAAIEHRRRLAQSARRVWGEQAGGAEEAGEGGVDQLRDGPAHGGEHGEPAVLELSLAVLFVERGGIFSVSCARFVHKI